MAQKPQLSLTAELERLEQSITLTLQGTDTPSKSHPTKIDHNFARAHRIVTTSILPIVERYSKESEAVWEGSKFWKQFFESSANVALSNYQEQDEVYDNNEQTEFTEAVTQNTYAEESTYPASSPGHYTERTVDFTRDQETRQTIPDHSDDDEDGLMDDSLLESLNLTGGATHSTPRKREKEPQWADMESPFETLRKELTMKNYDSPDVEVEPPQTVQRIPLNIPDSSTIDSIQAPSTPPQRRHMFDPETPESSPLREPPQTHHRTPGTSNKDPILHRVLDKTWRLQATPLGKTPSRYRTATTPKEPLFSKKSSYYLDDSPGSSPVEPVLHTQVFTPGPIRTPKPKQYGAAAVAAERQETYMWDEDDSDDLLLPPGMSPPKTMQFSLPPSKLLATPAREASKRIVHDILQTAGATSLDFSTTTDSSPPRNDRDYDDDPF
ncbi:DASH complex subunit Ask1-domain-containing protein [Geopyxis carbonaria]|nr:DASH complex subunit Ask1-domain-containing protein [Geopyxis carbonaria]